MITVLATSPNESFSVSRVEIDRGGPTYTLDTLRILKDFYGEGAELFFITGADAVLQILTWKDPGVVLQQAHFIAASRPEYELSELDLKRFEGRVTVMQIPALAISSTEIRERAAAGRPIRYLVPPEVANYIEEKGLYRAATPSSPSEVGAATGTESETRA